MMYNILCLNGNVRRKDGSFSLARKKNIIPIIMKRRIRKRIVLLSGDVFYSICDVLMIFSFCIAVQGECSST